MKRKAKKEPQSQNEDVQDMYEDWLAKQAVTHVKSKAGYVAEDEEPH